MSGRGEDASAAQSCLSLGTHENSRGTHEPWNSRDGDGGEGILHDSDTTNDLPFNKLLVMSRFETVLVSCQTVPD